MATTDIRGTRRTGSSATNGVQAAVQQNEFDEQLVAQGMPPYAEMTRLGQGWSVMSTSALAALVTRPTTTAGYEIFNGYASGGPSLIIDRIFAEWRIATAVGSGAIMYAGVTAPKAAVTAGAFTVRGNSGKAYGGSVISAVSTTVVDPGWFPWGQASAMLGAATPMGGLEARVEGRLIVPPQCSLVLHVVASVTGDTFIQGASWYERTISNIA